jgi:hypothetical protein
MSIFTRKTAIFAKLESTYGVDAFSGVDPANNTDMLEIFDVTVTPNIDKIDRNPFKASLSPEASIPSKKYTELSFYTELKGYGTDTNGITKEPKVTRLLQACGFSLTVNEFDDNSDGTTDRKEYLLTPTSNNIKSVTFYVYLDGVLYKIPGARGNVQVQLEANNIGKFNFTFTGLFVKPVDKAFPSIKTDELTPPLVKNVNLTMGGYAPILSSFEIDMQNDVVQRDDMNAEEGIGSVDIIGRNPVVSMNPDMMLVADYDIWGKFINNEEVLIKGIVGSDLGNKVQIDVPRVVYNSLGIGDRDSVRIYDVSGTCTGNDDEVQITFI